MPGQDGVSRREFLTGAFREPEALRAKTEICVRTFCGVAISDASAPDLGKGLALVLAQINAREDDVM